MGLECLVRFFCVGERFVLRLDVARNPWLFVDAITLLQLMAGT